MEKRISYETLIKNFYNKSWWIDNWDVLTAFVETLGPARKEKYNQNIIRRLSLFINSYILENAIIKLYDGVLFYRDKDRHEYIYEGTGNSKSDFVDNFNNKVELKSLPSINSYYYLSFEANHDSVIRIYYMKNTGQLWTDCDFDDKFRQCRRQLPNKLELCRYWELENDPEIYSLWKDYILYKDKKWEDRWK